LRERHREKEREQHLDPGQGHPQLVEQLDELAILFRFLSHDHPRVLSATSASEEATLNSDLQDVIVVGGGPAGLAAALWCGRYSRSVLVFDDGTQRNLVAHASHGYLGSDRIDPVAFLAAARRDALAYPTVTIEAARLDGARRGGGGFEVTGGGQMWSCDRLILATGVADLVPDVPGFGELYGTSVFHCSCCDGYESRDQQVVAIGWGDHAAGFALDLLAWGAKVSLVTGGHAFEGDRGALDALRANGVEVVDEPIVELEHRAGALTAARLASGRELAATRAFFSIGHRPRTDLAAQLGCEVDGLGYVAVDTHGATSVPHVYAAGDITPGEQLVQTAAAEGAVAGIACALSLRGTRPRGPSPDPGPDPKDALPGG
jgi:thioredoxin reductase